MLDPTFVKTRQGFYRTRGEVTSETIIRKAAALLLEGLCDGREMSSAIQTADFLHMSLANLPNEQFSVLFLNNRNQLIACEHLFKGTINCTVVHPRVVAQRALTLNAAAVIVAHNHPSGETEPSKADVAITEILKEALALLDIRLLDHFIVTRTNCISFVERGLM